MFSLLTSFVILSAAELLLLLRVGIFPVSRDGLVRRSSKRRLFALCYGALMVSTFLSASMLILFSSSEIIRLAFLGIASSSLPIQFIFGLPFGVCVVAPMLAISAVSSVPMQSRLRLDCYCLLLLIPPFVLALESATQPAGDYPSRELVTLVSILAIIAVVVLRLIFNSGVKSGQPN